MRGEQAGCGSYADSVSGLNPSRREVKGEAGSKAPELAGEAGW